MGANAVTTVYDFTAGQVLTAAQMDNVNCGIPVFATTTTRDAAFGGTGEKTLAEGQMAYIENIAGSSAVQYYDGSAWQTLVVGGMTYITGASFSAVSTVSMAAGVFTTAYKTYKVILQVTAASTDIDILCRVNVAGTPTSSAGAYFWSKGGVFTNASTNDQGGNSTSALINEARNSTYLANVTNDITIYDPANASSYTQATGTFIGAIDNNGIGAAGSFGFVMASAAANDGLTFTTNTGTISGFYRVYALSES